jgi:hypothetical protein
MKILDMAGWGSLLKFWYEMRRQHALRIAGIYFTVGWLLIERGTTG